MVYLPTFTPFLWPSFVGIHIPAPWMIWGIYTILMGYTYIYIYMYLYHTNKYVYIYIYLYIPDHPWLYIYGWLGIYETFESQLRDSTGHEATTDQADLDDRPTETRRTAVVLQWLKKQEQKTVLVGGLEQFLVFYIIINDHQHWLIFFRVFETTNQYDLWMFMVVFAIRNGGKNGGSFRIWFCGWT